jgi:hypothetical protein
VDQISTFNLVYIYAAGLFMASNNVLLMLYLIRTIRSPSEGDAGAQYAADAVQLLHIQPIYA